MMKYKVPEYYERRKDALALIGRGGKRTRAFEKMPGAKNTKIWKYCLK